MEGDSVVEMEDVGERVRDFPALCQPGRDIEVVAAGKHVVEDQAVDAFRECVHPDAGIEVCRT